LRPRATLGSAWVPVAVAASRVNHPNDEHHGNRLWEGFGSMELSPLAIPSREQDLKPGAPLGSAWIPFPVAVAA
jgi:hypothetical protein